MARTIKSRGVDEVHDLRVAIRRFKRVLFVLKQCFPRSESRRIRRALKKIMVQAGDVRNRDIALRLVEKLVPSESAPLVRELRAERGEAAKTLAALLRRWVRRNLSDRWRNALDHEGDATAVEATARRMLPQMARDLFSCGKDAARDKASAAQLHRFRIAAKNLRYTLDVFAPLYGASLNGLLRQLKGVQTLLGEINDCATVREMLAHQKTGSELPSKLKKRQRRKTAQFRRRWDADFSGATTIRQWTDILSHVDGHTPLTRKPPARSTPKSATRSAGNARTA